MQRIDREIGMVPVDQGIVEADAQPFCAEGVDIRAHQVAAGGRVGRFVVGVLAVEQAEPLVVLRRQDGVFHTGRFRLTRPFFRIEQIGVEVFEIQVVAVFRDAFVVLDPFMAGGHGVQPPVDEHAEAVMREPCGIARGLAGDVTGHDCSSIF